MKAIRIDRRAALWLVILGIATVAIAFRVYAIDRLPPGLFGDEAVEGLDALDVLAGNLAIWFRAHYGREPIYVYLVALSYLSFGVSALSTRLPAVIAGLLTVPATFFFTREWARQALDQRRALRVSILTTILISLSFWHIQMTRNAHRVTLLPLVEAVGYYLLWRARRTGSRLAYAGSGLVLGLAIYTYSPGRFVGIFVAAAVGLDLLIQFADVKFASGSAGQRSTAVRGPAWTWSGVATAGALAVAVMLPLFIYFLRNPGELTRRFDSVSVFDTESPAESLVASVSGNLAQFVIPGAGYQSKHYNLPGKPVFDLALAPWFLVGLGVGFWKIKRAEYRFLVLWFVVMLVPAFLTADMIPKGVRALGIVPGVFVFPALAMDAILARARSWRAWTAGLVGLSILVSTLWTAYDYFVVWANMPELPLAFDADLEQVSAFIQRQPADRTIYISTEVYRPPTEMLLGRLVPTSRYVDQATRVREFDARSSLPLGDQSGALYVFVREQKPDDVWLSRVAKEQRQAEQGTYYTALYLSEYSPPQHALDQSVGPYLKLVGYSLFADEPSGIALYWRVEQIAQGREDFQETISLRNASGQGVTQDKHQFPVTPLEWGSGDEFVEWRTIEWQDPGNLSVELSRAKDRWRVDWSISQ